MDKNHNLLIHCWQDMCIRTKIPVLRVIQASLHGLSVSEYVITDGRELQKLEITVDHTKQVTPIPNKMEKITPIPLKEEKTQTTKNKQTK